jgi:hypothetical protein
VLAGSAGVALRNLILTFGDQGSQVLPFGSVVEPPDRAAANCMYRSALSRVFAVIASILLASFEKAS